MVIGQLHFYKVKSALGICLVALSLASCNCNPPLEVTAIQKSDKKLACKDIILEINEAEHYRAEAVESRKVGFGELFMPTCWISGYVNGQQAIKSAAARIDYLGHIYDLLDCGGANASADDEDDDDSLLSKSKKIHALPSHKGLTSRPIKDSTPSDLEDDEEESGTPTSAGAYGKQTVPDVRRDEQGKRYRPLGLPAK